MRKLPLLIASILVAVAAPVAQAATPPPVPLLWKVSDGDNALYLLGSFHLLKPSDYPLSKDVDVALADAESLLFELSPAEMESPALATSMMQAGLRMDGTTLDAEVGPGLAAKLDAWAAAQPPGTPINGEVLQRFEPWFAALTVSLLQMTSMGLDPELGLDRHFMALAGKAGKPVGGLETGAQQVALFDGMDGAEQVQLLADALADASSGTDQLESLHADWRAGRAEALWNGLAADMRREYPQLYQRINVDRNQAWLPTLSARLEAPGDDDTLVVVGALHLLGEDGVVQGLRDRGYAVERICSDCK
ncbi:MAG TPA: TraB/GumN family protein [Xanthomonadaceae bacterium]|nr:TraB/GumN family protein [Xanthomonadaceae bacterium]